MSDDEPRFQPPKTLVLDDLSEDDLEARITSLQEEIKACEAELEKKRSHRSAADKLFGS